MVKSDTQKQHQQNESEASSSTSKFKGVRKRKWGKYVSEIRLPNSRQRIWLGSYDTAEKAARAFDAALYCLRGRSAKFNFPDNPPEIVNGRSLTPAEIQVAAARFANSVSGSSHSGTGRVENLEPDQSTSLSSSELLADSPSPSVSNGAVQLDSEMTNLPFDSGFLDTFSNLTSENTFNNDNSTHSDNNFANYGIFPGFDDFSGDYYVPPFPNVDYGDENSYEFSSEGSFLWNF